MEVDLAFPSGARRPDTAWIGTAVGCLHGPKASGCCRVASLGLVTQSVLEARNLCQMMLASNNMVQRLRIRKENLVPFTCGGAG